MCKTDAHISILMERNFSITVFCFFSNLLALWSLLQSHWFNFDCIGFFLNPNLNSKTVVHFIHLSDMQIHKNWTQSREGPVRPFHLRYEVNMLVTQSCPTLCTLMDCCPPGSSVHRFSPGKNTGVGCYSLLQGIFLTQGLNLSLLRCRQVLYLLRHWGGPHWLYK